MEEQVTELIDQFAKQTLLSPASILCTLIALVFIFTASRKYVLIPFLIGAFLISENQRISWLGFDFTSVRVLIFASLFRIILKKEHADFQLMSIDKAFIGYVLCTFILYMVCRGAGTFTNRLGFLINSLGLYSVLRIQIYDEQVVEPIIYTMAGIAIVIGITIIYERITHNNIFAILQNEPFLEEIRNNKVRCQGPFAHSLLAGAFGATLFPLMTILTNKKKKSKMLGIAGMVACVIITVFSNTSGNIMALAAGAFALFLWPLRYKMRSVRWGIIALIIVLQIMMKVPFYWVLSKIDIVGGSTSWHRSFLIDCAIKNFFEWFLVGTKSTAHWGWGMWDMTNQFIAVGVEGGLLTLILFVSVIVLCFKYIGRAIHHVDVEVMHQKMYWAMGAAMIAHLTAFIGMHYFGAKAYLNYYSLLCIITAVTKFIHTVPPNNNAAANS